MLPSAFTRFECAVASFWYIWARAEVEKKVLFIAS